MVLLKNWISQAIAFSIIFNLISGSISTEKEYKQRGGIALQNIKHYETVNYNVTNVHKQHLDAVNFKNNSVNVKFSAFQRYFCLLLENHKSLFSEETEFRISVNDVDEYNKYDRRTAYKGTVEGDPESFVMGHIINGQFDGSFVVFGETFHLEPVQRYGIGLNASFHSIVFSSLSVKFDFSRIRRKMARFPHLRHHVAVEAASKRIRRRRSTSSSLNTCTVHIAADHLFFKHVGLSSERATVAEMVYHMGMADRAFRATDFNQDGGSGDGIGFVIAAVTVFHNETSEGSLASPESIKIVPFLEKWGEIDHDSYCLALLFTYRDFEDGALGLAWVADPELDTPGGICSKRLPVDDLGEEKFNFNTAIASFKNLGVRIPRKASVITVVHELGHSFGSEHDPDSAQCSPGGKAGNFIMYSRASDGHEPNNLLFSPCSKRQIALVISRKGADCFIAHNNGSYCGNKIVEQGEDCDCGRPTECQAVDKCCVARDDKLGTPGCTVRPGMQCSHVAGTCCSEDCRVIPESQARVCQTETECRVETTFYSCPRPVDLPLNATKHACVRFDGETTMYGWLHNCMSQPSHDLACVAHGISTLNGRCPEEWRPSNVTCNSGSNTCLDGACTGSICALYGTNECECHDDPDEMCHVCCNNSLAVCVSASYYLGRVILKRPGSTCKLHTGYCDSFGFCITVDSDDILKNLRDAFKRLFSKAAMNSLWHWIKGHWYFLLISIGGICLIIVLLKVTYRSRTSLTGLARRTVLRCIVGNQRAMHVRNHEVSGAEFDEVVGDANL